MSTVLWANLLHHGTVTCDQSDKWALHRHTRQLDQLAKRAAVAPFSSLLDHTDARFNSGDAELPAGMRSTDDLMARDGVWRSADEALRVLRGLLRIVVTDKPRFGLMRDDHDDVVAELAESIEHAERAAAMGALFNLCVAL